MADTLTSSSRNFYERVKMKVLISVVVSCAGLMLLGFCSIAAGQSSANQQREDNVDEDDQEKVYSALSAGYGEIDAAAPLDNVASVTDTRNSSSCKYAAGAADPTTTALL